MNILKTRRVTADDRTWIASTIARLTGGDDPRPRLDWKRLTDREQEELLDAVQRATAEGRGIDRAQLDDGFWRLVAKASGWPEDRYERRRAEALAAAKEARSSADRRRLRLDRREQQALLVVIYDDLSEGKLWVDDVAVTVTVLAMFGKGQPFPGAVARLEGRGLDASLHIDMRYGLAARVDGTDALAGAQARLLYLSGQGSSEDPLRGDDRYFLIERSGQNWTISLGPRLRSALGHLTKEDENL